MSNSLRVKLSKLRHKGEITHEEYKELISKLDGHDKIVYNQALNDFIKATILCLNKLPIGDDETGYSYGTYDAYWHCVEIAKGLKKGGKNENN